MFMLAVLVISTQSCKDDKGEGPLSVVVPCGTGTTALLLQHDLDVLRATKPLPINVVAVPCVGDDDYLERQMNSLNKAMGKIVLTPRWAKA